MVKLTFSGEDTWNSTRNIAAVAASTHRHTLGLRQVFRQGVFSSKINKVKVRLSESVHDLDVFFFYKVDWLVLFTN